MGILEAYVDVDGRVATCPNIPGQHSLNYLKVGFAKAFAEVEQPECENCMMTYNLEYHISLSLKLGSIINTLRILNWAKGRKLKV